MRFRFDAPLPRALPARLAVVAMLALGGLVAVSLPVPPTLVCDAVTTTVAPSASPETSRFFAKTPPVQVVVDETLPTERLTVPFASWQVPLTG